MTAIPSPLGSPMNHVFVDFENVHQVDLTLIGAKSVSFTLLVGPQQTKLESGLVEKLMEHSASVRLVKLKSKSKNALDFALAYYLGRAALADPTAYFHVIAMDGGYDPLIEHLRERHINVRRHKACADLGFSWSGKKLVVEELVAEKIVAVKTVAKKAVAKKAAAKKAAAKKVPTKTVAKKAAVIVKPGEMWMNRVLKDFNEHPQARPKKRTALIAKIANLIAKKPGGPEVQGVIDRMVRSGKLSFDEKDVPEYRL